MYRFLRWGRLLFIKGHFAGFVGTPVCCVAFAHVLPFWCYLHVGFYFQTACCPLLWPFLHVGSSIVAIHTASFSPKWDNSGMLKWLPILWVHFLLPGGGKDIRDSHSSISITGANSLTAVLLGFLPCPWHFDLFLERKRSPHSQALWFTPNLARSLWLGFNTHPGNIFLTDRWAAGRHFCRCMSSSGLCIWTIHYRHVPFDLLCRYIRAYVA